jgi:hypothetical protein
VGKHEDLPSPDVVRVECYAGYRGEQEPRRFVASGAVVEVLEVVDRWQGPDHRYFKVRGSEGGVHLLRHDEVSGFWERIPSARDEAEGGTR